MAAKERQPLPTSPLSGHLDSLCPFRVCNGVLRCFVHACRVLVAVLALQCANIFCMYLLDDPIPELKRHVGRELARAFGDAPLDDLTELLETDAPRISDIRHGRLRRFSLERLIRYAQRFGLCARITFEPRAYQRQRST